MTEIFNTREEKPKRQALRRNMTPAEAKLWLQLQRRQMIGFRFRRQYSVGPYVLDFYCPRLRLAIEVDGDSHYMPGGREDDERRARFIEQFGVRFLRFTNVYVFQNLDGVMEVILSMITALDASAEK